MADVLSVAVNIKERTGTGCKTSCNEKQLSGEPKSKRNLWTSRAGVAALLLGDGSVIMLMTVKDDTGTNKTSFI